METLTTKGITINVETYFLEDQSNPSKSHFCHAYQINILNNSDRKVKLLSRHWIIRDSNKEDREVIGNGVVGEQPELSPGEFYEYVSWCPIESEIGEMYGAFVMLDMDSEDRFDVVVPKFQLIFPPKLN